MPELWWRWQSKEKEKMKDYTNSRMIEVIGEYIHSERDRNLLIRRYVDGITYEKLAEEFDISVAQVKRIIYRHENMIFRNL